MNREMENGEDLSDITNSVSSQTLELLSSPNLNLMNGWLRGIRTKEDAMTYNAEIDKLIEECGGIENIDPEHVAALNNMRLPEGELPPSEQE